MEMSFYFSIFVFSFYFTCVYIYNIDCFLHWMSSCVCARLADILVPVSGFLLTHYNHPINPSLNCSFFRHVARDQNLSRMTTH